MKRLVTGVAAALFAFATGSATGVTPPNYQLKAAPRGAAQKAPRPGSRTESRIRWVTERGPELPLSPLSYDKRPDAAARSALHGAAGKLGFAAADADMAELRELHDLGRGAVIARYQQKYNGLDVFGAKVNVVMDRNYRPVAYSGGFAKVPPAASTAATESRSASTGGFALSASAATQAALRDLGRSSRSPGLSLLHAPDRIDRMYYAGASGMIPAYRLAISAAQVDGAHPYAYGYLVSAVDGTILVRVNLLADLDFTYRAYAGTTPPYKPFDGPLGNARTPFQGANPADNPARMPVASNLVTLQNGPISTNDPWLADSATSTNGRNVRAYADNTSPDGLSGDTYATVTATRTFNYASTADADPTGDTARDAGVVNMFFMMNWLHDFWYDHGFDEAAGNAQLDNFGRGGLAADPVVAQSQDFNGRNNANMFTPPDGSSPIMQMYLWDGGSASLDVTSPALGMFIVGTAEFGDQVFTASGNLATVNDGTGTVTDGCEAFGGVTGLIAVIDRGNCNFQLKAVNAQAAGAIGALIVNNVPNDGAPGMSLGVGDPPVTIPVLSVSLEDGDTLKAALGGGTVTVTMERLAGQDRDAALDNGIIAHEFFHYVSNRLVNDAFGLINQQGRGMGEGWSDFSTMMLAVRPEDQALAGNATWGGTYSTGLYVDNSAYFGIRRVPYSTDFAVNPLTFQHIQDGVPLPNTAPIQFGASGAFNSEVHSTGEIWANMLWEAYAALLNDPRYTFAEAEARMQDYVIAGLKALPMSPTFVEARDGILAAARATDEADFELIAEAFAKRGIGAGAIAPDPDSTDNVGVTESYVALAAQYTIEDFGIDAQYDDGTVGYCDLDQAFDPGETALLGFTVVSGGTLDLAAGATIQVSTDGAVTLPNGGLVTLPALAVGETFAVAMPITLDSAGGTAEPLTITLDFPEAGGTPDAVFEPATMNRVLNVNLDLGPVRNFDDMELTEASQSDWTVALTNPASGPPWIVTDDYDGTFSSGGAWYAHDNSTTSSSRLTTPEFAVAGTFSMTFDHYFEFEEPDIYDGGVMEISINGGTFVDVTAAGGSFGAGQGYNGVAQTPFPSPRAAWVGTNGAMEAVTLSFGTALAGDTARIRFRLEADESVGAFGWVVDNVVLNGITTPVFSGPVAEDSICGNFLPLANAGADQSVNEGAAVSLAGTAGDRNGDTLTYAWTRVSGPGVTLTNATTLTPTFTAPNVSTNTAVTLRLTVSDGTDSATDDVVVSIQNTGGGGGGGGGGALGSELALAGLLALLRRRRQPAA
jgi:hypothetical protein